MSMTYRIQSAQVAGDKTLAVTFASGKTMMVDMSETIARIPAFAPLADPALFAQAAVVDYGWTVEWPNGVSVAAERLYQRALEQMGRAWPAEEFRKWMERNDLSLTEAAEALGLTRRTVSQYSSGARPVPRYIGLACAGWEALHRHAA
ncbi:MAG: DUF2442 domain-containing protein [Acidithiobacillus sp.]